MRGITRAGLAALAALAGCSQVLGLRDVSVNDAAPDMPGTPPDNTTSYVSTNTRGELARWDVNGAALKGTWEIPDTAGTLMRTLTISATCSNPDATYGTRSCTVTSVTCAGACSSADMPPASAVYTTLELPGAVLVVVGALGTHTVLHIGLSPDPDCPIPGATMTENVSAFVGFAHPQLFGISRVTAGFNPLVYANFFMGPGACTSSTPTGNCTSTPPIVDILTTNGMETATDWSCSNGIQTMRLGSSPLQAMRSSTGAALTMLPEFAGELSFPMAQAAAISNFGSRTFVGMLVLDSGPPISAVATTGPASTAAPITSIQFNVPQTPFVTNPVIRPALNATSSLTAPAYPDFTAAPQGSYMNNTVLQPVYPSVSKIPGLFVVDGATAPNRARLIFVAGKQNGKLVGIGTLYDWVNNGAPPPTPGYMSSGMFVLVEKP